MCDQGRRGGLPRDGLSSPSSLDLAGYTGVELRETSRAKAEMVPQGPPGFSPHSCLPFWLLGQGSPRPP